MLIRVGGTYVRLCWVSKTSNEDECTPVPHEGAWQCACVKVNQPDHTSRLPNSLFANTCTVTKHTLPPTPFQHTHTLDVGQAAILHLSVAMPGVQHTHA